MTPNTRLGPPATPHCSSSHPACLRRGLWGSKLAPSPPPVLPHPDSSSSVSVLCWFLLFVGGWVSVGTWQHNAREEEGWWWGNRKREMEKWQEEEEQRGEKKTTRLVIRGEKKQKTWAQVPDFLCRCEFRVTMATRQWSDVMGAWHSRDYFGGLRCFLQCEPALNTRHFKQSSHFIFYFRDNFSIIIKASCNSVTTEIQLTRQPLKDMTMKKAGLSPVFPEV